MRFDQDFIEKVKDANNLVDIIEQYGELKGRGDQYMGLCPFPDHKEKTPSFSVSESKQLYHCFGCKKSGNIFNFLESYFGFAFVESIEYLAKRASIPLPVEEKSRAYSATQGKVDKNLLHRVNLFTARVYRQEYKKLSRDHVAKTYFSRRGLSDEVIEEFQLGYSSDQWDHLHKNLQKNGVPLKSAEDLGLIKKNKNGGFFDVFRQRLIFPIISLKGDVVGFGGRIVADGQPKYLNSRESAIFKKSKILYGLNQSIRAIQASDQLIVVEGYMDFLALYSRGIKNVAATLGTALTTEHIQLIKRWTKNIVLIFDGDQAGQNAAERSLETFFSHDISPLAVVLPEGQDPDDAVREGGTEGFLKRVSTADELFTVLLRRWLQGYRGQAKDKINLMDRLTPLFQSIQDPRLKTILIDQVARRIDEDPKRVSEWTSSRKKVFKKPTLEAKQAPKTTQAVKITLSKAPRDEVMALGLAVKSLKLYDLFKNSKGLEDILDPTVKEIFTNIVENDGQIPKDFDKLAGLVVSKVKDPENIARLINISSPLDGDEQSEKMMKDCLIRLKDRHLQRQASVLAAEIKDQPSSEKLERIMNIQRDRMALKNKKTDL